MSKIFETDPVERFMLLSNDMIDEIMPYLAPVAFKIVMLIYRKTKGWHKDVDQISFSQIMEGTGIKSSATVAKHLDSLNEMGVILRMKGDGAWDINSYALNPNFDTSALKNKVGYSEHTLKNEASPALKNEATNLDLALKNEDTKNNPKKQKIYSEKIPNFSELEKTELNLLGAAIAQQANGNIPDKDALRDITIFGYRLSKELCPICVSGVAPKTLTDLARTTLLIYHKSDKEAALTGFKDWWYTVYWLGKDKGQPPTPAQVGETWGQYEAANRQHTPSAPSYKPDLTPEQLARYQELIGQSK